MARLPRIPDLLTTANLACGVSSILLASQGHLTTACWLVFAGAFFDVLDGLAARALGGGSPLGAQLDSLADMVTFGVAPAFLLFIQATGLDPVQPSALDGVFTLDHFSSWSITAAAIILVVASCWRLAKFNLDTRQTSGFLGLPTPANGLFWVSMVLVGLNAAVHPGPGHDVLLLGVLGLLGSSTFLLIACVITATLMLAEVPLPSLKFAHFKWSGNQVIYLLMGIGAILILLYGILAVPLILLLYLLSPLWGRLFPKTP